MHPQLRALWSTPALRGAHSLLEPPSEPGRFSSLREKGAFSFVPLLTEQLHVLAELDIVMLRQQPPGNVLSQGGDIDNQLKTLLDALSIPRHPESLPRDTSPSDDERPFFCLLEDDCLVSSLSVRTEQLLEPLADKGEVDAMISVRPRATANLVGNWMFGR
jgi:hypothetical protein